MPDLTETEENILRMIVGQMSDKEIAFALDVSENTAKTYVKGILLKLGAADRAEAVAEGFERGLLNIGED